MRNIKLSTFIKKLDVNGHTVWMSGNYSVNASYNGHTLIENGMCYENNAEIIYTAFQRYCNLKNYNAVYDIELFFEE